MREWFVNIRQAMWVREIAKWIWKIVKFLSLVLIISIVLGLVVEWRNISFTESQTPWVIAVAAIGSTWITTLFQAADRKQHEQRVEKHQERVEKLLEGILSRQDGEGRLDDHGTAVSDSDDRQEMETVMEQSMGHRKPDRAADQESSWRRIVYLGLGIIVLIFIVIWLSLRLSGDDAMWRPILYAWTGIALALCVQAAYLEWINIRQEIQRQERHDQVVSLLKEISKKLGSGGAGDE